MSDIIAEYFEQCFPGQLLYASEIAKMFNISAEEADRRLREADFLSCMWIYCPICHAISTIPVDMSDNNVCPRCNEQIGNTIAKKVLMYRKRMPEYAKNTPRC